MSIFITKKMIDLCFMLVEAGVWFGCMRYFVFQENIYKDIENICESLVTFDKRMSWYRGPNLIHTLRVKRMIK